MNGYMNSGIRVTYPRTKYMQVNEVILEKISKIVLEFLDESSKAQSLKTVYTLDISYEDYSYKNIESFVFFVSTYVGDQSSNLIFTVNYDSSLEKLVKVQDLFNFNSKILDVFSEESYLCLSKNEKITDLKILKEGTKSDLKNFQNIVFTPLGIKIYFSKEQVAPYNLGSYQVVVDYKKLESKIS